VRHDELHVPVPFVDDDPYHLSRSDGVTNKPSRIAIPWDNVDLFSSELLHNRLNPRPFHPDARTYGVDIRIAAAHGNLGSCTRLSCRRHDSHDPFINFRYFHFEKFDEKAHLTP